MGLQCQVMFTLYHQGITKKTRKPVLSLVEG